MRQLIPIVLGPLASAGYGIKRNKIAPITRISIAYQ